MPPVSYGRILSLFRPLFNNIYRAMKETPFVSVNSVDPAPRFRAAKAGDAGPCAAFPPDKAGRRIAAMGFPVRFVFNLPDEKSPRPRALPVRFYAQFVDEIFRARIPSVSLLYRISSRRS